MAKPIRKIVQEIFFNPETQKYSSRTRFADNEAWHYVRPDSDTMEWALLMCDQFKERIWEKPDGADPNVLLISREYKEGTVGWKSEQYVPSVNRGRRR